MIIKYWVDFHKFGCAPLYGIFSGITRFFKKVAPIALPIIGFAVAGPLGLSAATGAAIGGAAGGLISGGGIKGALIGGLTGYAGGKLATGGFGGGFFGGGTGAAGGGAVNFARGAGAGGIMGMSGTGAGTTAMLGGLAAPSAGMAAAAQRGFGTAAGKNVSLLGQFQASGSGLKASTGALSGGLKSVGQGVVAGYTGGVPQYKTASTVQKGALQQGFTFDREKIEELVGAGFSAYEGDIRQQQIEATQKNLDQYQDEFADFYSAEAKKQQEALARGELPKTYEAALEREKDRLTRLMVAQGHNPAESGFGADTVVRGLMDLESKFIGEERDYWKSIGAGAEGMQARIQELQSRDAREPDVGLAGMGELATKVAGTLADLI